MPVRMDAVAAGWVRMRPDTFDLITGQFVPAAQMTDRATVPEPVDGYFQQVRLADEIGNKHVARSLIDIRRRAQLLHFTC